MKKLITLESNKVNTQIDRGRKWMIGLMVGSVLTRIASVYSVIPPKILVGQQILGFFYLPAIWLALMYLAYRGFIRAKWALVVWIGLITASYAYGLAKVETWSWMEHELLVFVVSYVLLAAMLLFSPAINAFLTDAHRSLKENNDDVLGSLLGRSR
ncbi:MAG: hypothetical protein AAF206_16935 [Bacteroidota bacterium]